MEKQKEPNERTLAKPGNLQPALIAEVNNSIVTIRETPVISDADVAFLYGVETRRVNEAVKNNPEKFPAEYMFAISQEEKEDLRSKISTTKVSSKSRAQTKVFTEKGLYMLATVLKSNRAVDVTFAIIETFAKVRSLKRELKELHMETDKKTPEQQDAAFRRGAFRYCHARSGDIGDRVFA